MQDYDSEVAFGYNPIILMIYDYIQQNKIESYFSADRVYIKDNIIISAASDKLVISYTYVNTRGDTIEEVMTVDYSDNEMFDKLLNLILSKRRTKESIAITAFYMGMLDILKTATISAFALMWICIITCIIVCLLPFYLIVIIYDKIKKN